MTQIRIKRVYEQPETEDGYRVLVDRLWPRGIKKEALKFDVWEKEITPSASLRAWFHENDTEHWDTFISLYKKELTHSNETKMFIEKIRKFPVVTLLYASKDPIHNHALILQEYLQDALK